MALKAVGSNPIIHPIKKQRNRIAIPLFLYGVIESCTIRTHYKLHSNLYNLRVADINESVLYDTRKWGFRIPSEMLAALA